MSVTISDLLKLPSLRRAEVVAGRRGLSKIISSVSVFETFDVDVPSNRLLLNDEILITGFLNSYNDCDQQLEIVKSLSEGGEAGIIVFYLGVFLKHIDPRIIKYANEHDFVIICMPRNQPMQRYSYVINDIMTAIVKDRLSGASITVSLLEQVSRLPKEQQNVNTMLRLLSERLSADIILVDEQMRILSEVFLPNEKTDSFKELKDSDLPQPGEPPVPFAAIPGSTVCRRALRTESGVKYEMILISSGSAPGEKDIEQAQECVQLAVNLWGQHHGEAVISELINAIITNEPVKMRSLAAIFNIDVTSVHVVWIFSGADFSSEAVQRISEAAENYCETAFADIYDGMLLLFTSDVSSTEDLNCLTAEMLSMVPENAVLSVFNNQKTTSDVRRSYLQNRKYLDDTKKIIPGRRIFFGGDIEFAETCRKKIDGGEESIEDALSILSSLDSRRDGDELKNTLAVYLLDAGQNVQRAAELMFVHRNTIKYRLRIMSDCFGFPVGTMPASYHVYKAVALRRIISG